tara:strand:+ start:9897 stop:13454 length:3558 start_codon:yes stop_codon:yes gene_type:complete
MKIIKRDGREVTVKFDKITNRIEGVIKTFNDLSYDRQVRLTESRDKIDQNKPILDIDPILVSQKVCSALVDKIKTEQIDRIAAEISQTLCVSHPDYSILAGLICISNLHKCTPKTFNKYAESLHDDGVLDDSTFEVATKYKVELQELLDDNDDYSYDFFAFKTLEKSYLIKCPQTKKVIERPQYLWLRVSIGIHGDNLPAIVETYRGMVDSKFTHASPTLFNAGTIRPQLASCFLLEMQEDSIDGIYDTLKQCALISKYSGGIGLHISKIRGNGAHIAGTNGTTDGIVPMCRVFEKTMAYVNQSGRRAGAFAIYIEPWHVDIEEFLELRLPTGAEEKRCRDLFTAVFVNDIFMNRVEKDEMWSLFNEHHCPGLCDAYGEEFDKLYLKYESEGKYVKQVKAQEVWFKMITSCIMSGAPYITFKDAINKKSNQKNIGTIKSSNLCVAPETMILTSNGYLPISTLADQDVSVWNGKEFSQTIVKQTGENQKLIKVNLSNGTSVECTEYHKFYISKDYWSKTPVVVEAKDLEPGMKLIKFDLPEIESSDEYDMDGHKKYYTHGLFCADGSYQKNLSKDFKCNFKCLGNNEFCGRHLEHRLRGGKVQEPPSDSDGLCKAISQDFPHILLYGEKMNLISHLSFISCGNYDDTQDRMRIQLHYDTRPKYEVPLKETVNNKISWLMGYCDGDACITNNDGCQSLQMSSTHQEFLLNILYMLQTLGIQSKINIMKDSSFTMLPDHQGGMKEYKTQRIFRLIVASKGLSRLVDMGFQPNRLIICTTHKTNRSATHFTKVVSIEDNDRYDSTFCFTEPKENKGVFNGNLLGNCAEINEVSTPDETAVCNLASMSIPTFIDRKTNTFRYESFGENVQIVVRNLNKVIDRSFYPDDKCKKSNFRHRPIGIGCQGLHTAFMILGYDFESQQAKDFNRNVYETMYYYAVKESCELAKKDGPYETFQGSPLSEGKFQFDLWGVQPSDRYDWEALRQDVKTSGVKNSLLLTQMPTAGSSNLLMNSESIDPINSNLFSRKISAGEYIIVNKYLVHKLIKLGIWSNTMKDKLIAFEGSVRYIDEIPQEVKSLFKTCWEMSMKSIIEMAGEDGRGPFICQSQSMNLFMESPTHGKISSMWFYSWKNGLKTGQYYLRSRAQANAAKFGIDQNVEEEATRKKKAAETAAAREVCSRENPEGCVMCSS